MKNVRTILITVIVALVAVMAVLASLLILIKAPTGLFWMLEILGREQAQWPLLLALLVGVPLIVLRRRVHRAALILAIVAIACVPVLLWPTVSAIRAAHRVAPMLASIGDTTPLADSLRPARPSPVVPAELFTRPSAHVIPVTHTIRAADGTSLPIDIYEPETNEGPAPCIVVIYGGAWQHGTRADLPELNSYLASRGYVVAAITYRLAPQSRFPSQVDDVRAALTYLEQYARPLGIDANRFVLIGRSAGAHLAMQTAFDAPRPSLRGVVSLYGPADLRWGWQHPSNPRVIDSQKALRLFLGGPLDSIAATYDQASPLRHVSDTSVPVLAIHGDRDELVSVHHLEMLDSAFAAHRRPHAVLRLPWATHGCDYFLNGPCGQVTTWAVERFIAAVTRGAPRA